MRQIHRKWEIKVSARKYDKDDTKWLAISVADNGIGMTEDQLSKIFQDYIQADRSTAAQYGGTGLGLTITTSLVQMMGGHLEVESEYGKGTCLRLMCRAIFKTSKMSRPMKTYPAIAARGDDYR